MNALQGCDALLLECNHDEALLRASSYPAGLKAAFWAATATFRIRARRSCCRLLHPGLGHVVAAHLSESNNSMRGSCGLGWHIESG
ncbi:hypothetical protein ACVBEH_17420 [Roseateles sp. GG27B]